MQHYLALIFATILACSYGQGAKKPVKPLLFHYDPKDETQVQILWNPTMGINKILEVSQREVTYTEDPEGDPLPHFQPWRVLVREEDGHDHSKRYAFVKDDPCSEVDFKVGWVDTQGKIHKDVIQSMTALPVSKEFGSKIKREQVSYDEANDVVKVKVSWSADVTQYDSRKIGPVIPKLDLNGCQMVFKRPVKEPSITEGGKLLLFPKEYATHKCNFTMRLAFGVFDKDIACKAEFMNTEEEALNLRLDCDYIDKLDCLSADIQNCDINCVPRNVFAKPEFTLDDNKTNLAVSINWDFAKEKEKEILKYQIRTFHSWLEHENRAFDIENVHETFLPKNKTSIELEALSVRHHAMWVLQVCAIYDKGGCSAKGEWDKVPEFGVFYYKLHDELPPWLKERPVPLIPAPVPVPKKPPPPEMAPEKSAETPPEAKVEPDAAKIEPEEKKEPQGKSAEKDPAPAKPKAPQNPAQKGAPVAGGDKAKAEAMVANKAGSEGTVSVFILLVMSILIRFL